MAASARPAFKSVRSIRLAKNERQHAASNDQATHSAAPASSAESIDYRKLGNAVSGAIKRDIVPELRKDSGTVEIPSGPDSPIMQLQQRGKL